MRWIAAACVTAAIMMAPPAAFAATGCQHRNGVTINCGGDPDAARAALARQPELSPSGWIALVAIVGGLFVLIALMPRFDNAHGNAWDRQEGDD